MFRSAQSARDDFRGDKDLPKDLNRVTPKDYLHSGYDMGHLIPSEDRSRTTKQNEGTFLRTNMTPQRPDLNRGPWRYLEDYTRKIATEKGKDVQVIAGGVMPDRMKTIGSGVAVPTAFFKIAVVLDKGKGLDSVDANTEVIAVMMPNKQGILARKWTDFLSTPKDIEKATGYGEESQSHRRPQVGLQRCPPSPLRVSPPAPPPPPPAFPSRRRRDRPCAGAER